ncbi:helix-turn-helix transcriptional regulator [Umezawaea endophytica]|uniref:Helix-turn-helix transcriptional regulator n=1 Tax=Umezawaea endophytica TaxID=1654476 RepID=A0A9X2VIF5_9PSEU|nr:helix-turn-helix transcriptional regulator [Umezawaea endophytica]MCS7476694.1 helix-turn-helix transcriptional regulator [Umezawaea endophytica]
MSEALGEFLRSRRSRLTPKEVGLPDGRRRRTPGLRREEVAELAEIGVDWYVRLEQGRAVRPSPATIEALARALLLDDTERAHLEALARNGSRAPFEREVVPDATRRVVEAMTEPAYVTGRRWDLLVCNTAAVELFGDMSGNVLEHLLLDPAGRTLFGAAWEGQAAHAVAQFRVAYDLWAPDRAFVDLADRLRRGCPEFEVWWDGHDVVGGGAGRKVLNGVVHDYATFRVNEDPELRLTVYTAERAGSA